MLIFCKSRYGYLWAIRMRGKNLRHQVSGKSDYSAAPDSVLLVGVRDGIQSAATAYYESYCSFRHNAHKVVLQDMSLSEDYNEKQIPKNYWRRI